MIEGDGSAWFQTVSSEERYRSDFNRVRVDQVRMPDGEVAGREVVETTDAVAIVPVTDDGDVLLVRQYRHPFGEYQLEIPAGKLDVDGETVEAAAQRELAEEAGHRAGRLVHLATIRNSAGWSDEVTHIFLGDQLTAVSVPADFTAEHEEAHMEVVRMPLATAAEEARRGNLPDSKTVVGLLLASDQRARAAN